MDLQYQTLERAKERLFDQLNQLTVEQSNTLPQPYIMSVSWLCWHVAREIDLQISDLKGTQPLYFSEDWEDKFALDLPSDTKDWIHTAEEAAKVVITDRSILTNYWDAVMHMTADYLDNLNDEDLDEVIDDSWNPSVTRGARIVSIVDDAVMHSGQAKYARRLILGEE